MPRLVKVIYECGCSAFGNPDFMCPKHRKYVQTQPPAEMVRIDRCHFCRRLFAGEQFVWKKEKNKEAIAAHARCLVELSGWKSGVEGKYTYIAYRENDENCSNIGKSEQRQGYLCDYFS